MRRMLYALGSLTSLAALASCGGGGGSTGGGVLPPGPSGSYVQATPAPGMAPAPAGFCVSSAQSSAVLSVTSNPQGAWVEATTSAGQTYLLGQTPQSCRLNPTTNGVKVTVLGGVGQTPQTTTVAGNKSTTIFFNAVADSSGQAGIGGGTLAAMRKPQTASVRASSANIPRRAVGRAAGSAVAPGAFSVVYRPGALAMEGRTPADVERGLGAQGRPIGTFAGMAWRGVRVDPSQAASVQAQLSARADVAAVYPAHYRRLQAMPRPQGAAVMPNDTFMDPYDQWDMYHISVPAAWGITEGSSSVPIAVLDTGYDVNNQDLANKVTYSEVDVSATTQLTANPKIEDTDGHGTNVSGIAAALTNNGLGFAGVGWQTPLLEFKIFPDVDKKGVPCAATSANAVDCSALTSDDAAAIASAVAHGAKVINMSLGFFGPADPAEYNAVESAIGQGVVVVAAAGNDGTSTGIEYPGGYRGVISVGASAIQGDSCTSGTTPCDASSGTEMKASYSDYGLTSDGGSPAATVNQPTLLAPGGDPIGGASDLDNLHWIYNLSSTGVPASTGYQCNPAHSSGVCSSFFAGTSQATPHVAGAIALLRSIAPSLGPAQILALLQNPADSDNLNVAGQGAGRLDALKLLQAAGGTSGGSSAPPLGSFVAIAYIAGASNAPTILDQEYTQGVPVNADGTFRLSDIQTSAGYEVGVWLDTNHDGMVDQGDWFGVAGGASSPSRYTATGAYNYGTIVVQQVGASFVLQ